MLPSEDGESSDGESPRHRVNLPLDDGESSGDEEKNGRPRSFYSLSREIVEKKRAEQKRVLERRLREQSCSPEKKREVNFPQERVHRKDKMNYSAFVPAFVMRQSDVSAFQAKVEGAVLSVRLGGLSELVRRLSPQFSGPREICRELDGLLTELTDEIDAWHGDVIKLMDGMDITVLWTQTPLASAVKTAARCAQRLHKICHQRFHFSAGLACGDVSCLNFVPQGVDGLATFAEFVIAGTPATAARQACGKTDVVLTASAASMIGDSLTPAPARRLRCSSFGEEGDLFDHDGGKDDDDGRCLFRLLDPHFSDDDDDDDDDDEERREMCYVLSPEVEAAEEDDERRLRPSTTRDVTEVALRALTLFVPRTFDRALRFRYSYATYLNHAKISEVREVTVVALRLRGVDMAVEIERARTVVDLMYATVERTSGAMFKLAPCADGIEALFVFGLPGSVFDEYAVRAVAAANLLRDRAADAGYRLVAGIATKRAFCGVVGSPRRMEYCVLGDAVDEARFIVGVHDDKSCSDRLSSSDDGRPSSAWGDGRFSLEPALCDTGVVAVCKDTVRQTRHQVEYDAAVLTESGVASRWSGSSSPRHKSGLGSPTRKDSPRQEPSFVVMGWRRHRSSAPTPGRLSFLVSSSSAQGLGSSTTQAKNKRERYRQVAEIFERKESAVCAAVSGARSLGAAKALAESIPLLCDLHGMTLLRTLPPTSTYDNAALALLTTCGAWRGPLVLALDIIDAARPRRPSLLPSSSSSSTLLFKMLQSHNTGGACSPKSSTSTSSSYHHRVTSSTGVQILQSCRSPPPTTPKSSLAFSVPLSLRSHDGGGAPALSPRARARSFFLRKHTSQPQGLGRRQRRRTLADLMTRVRVPSFSAKKAPVDDEPLLKKQETPHHSVTSCGQGLRGRTAAIFAALPSKLHKYASVLNDMFLADERDPDLRDDKNVFDDATVMMRRARLVQLVVLILLSASRKANLCILVDSLEQMDDASWDVLYKLTQWQKKDISLRPQQSPIDASTVPASKQEPTRQQKFPTSGATKRATKKLRRLVGNALTSMSSGKKRSRGENSEPHPRPSPSPGRRTKESMASSTTAPTVSSSALPRKRRQQKYDGVDIAPFVETPVVRVHSPASPRRNPKCLVFVIAPVSSNLGSQRAEWLETKRLAEEYGAFIEVRPLDMDEALVVAAERLRLCAPDARDTEKKAAVALIEASEPLVDLVAATHQHVDVMISMLADAKAQGKIIAYPGEKPTLRVSPSLACLEPPLAHWLSTLSAVDALPARTQYVLAAASVFDKFTPSLLKKCALVHNDLGFIQAMCLDLCKPVEPTGRRLLHEVPAPSKDDLSLFDALRSGAQNEDDAIRERKKDKVYAFAEPMTHRALAGKLMESQILFALDNVADVDGLTLDDRDHLYGLICPYIRRKYSRRFHDDSINDLLSHGK